jgi:hypothetical protein
MPPSRQERLEDERSDRAFALLNGPLFWRFVHALDVCGWMIVRQDGSNGRPLVPWGSKRKHWPSWIEDWRKKPSPTLRLIECDKSDE